MHHTCSRHAALDPLLVCRARLSEGVALLWEVTSSLLLSSLELSDTKVYEP